MRRLPGRLTQRLALAVAVAAVIVLAAGVLAVVTWTSGSAPASPAAQAGTPAAGTTQPGASPAGPPSASASGQDRQSQGQQGDQLTAGAGHVASVPMSALPSGDAPGPGTIVALVIVAGVPSVSVRVAAMPGTLVQAATAGGYGARPALDDLPATSQGQAAGVPDAAVVLSLPQAAAAGGGSQAGGGQGGAVLSVTLSPDVAWQLDFGGGAGGNGGHDGRAGGRRGLRAGDLGRLGDAPPARWHRAAATGGRREPACGVRPGGGARPGHRRGRREPGHRGRRQLQRGRGRDGDHPAGLGGGNRAGRYRRDVGGFAGAGDRRVTCPP